MMNACNNLQGSVVTHSRCRGIFNYYFIANSVSSVLAEFFFKNLSISV